MRVLIISDLQLPFEHKDYLKFLKAVEKKYKTNHTVCVGDEIDFHSMSDYDHDPDGLSPGHELTAAIKKLQTGLYKAFPKMDVCTSNHTERPWRKALKDGTPKAFLRTVKEVLAAPRGWNWRSSWVIDDVKYQHGEGYSGQLGAYKAAVDNGMSTVIGHLHSDAGVQYGANPSKLFFGMNVGCLIDHKAYAFAYGKFMRKKPIISCGVILEGLPIVIPMWLNADGRWNGQL